MTVAKLELTETASDGDLATILNGLTDFNTASFGPSGRRSLTILIRGDDGAVTGGLSGYTGWDWLFTQWLFVPEALRGQGMVGKLLAMAEAEAVARNCHNAWIDTFNPPALRAYQRHGYTIFGALADFPPGHGRTFLQKRLVAEV